MRLNHPKDGARTRGGGRRPPTAHRAGGLADARRQRDRRWGRYSHLLSIVAAVMGGICFLVLTDGGRQTRKAKPLLEQVDHFAGRLGFGLDQAWISGHRKTSDREAFDALDMTRVRSLVGFDKAGAKHRIEQLPWVAEARILTVWPHRVEVQIREREPYVVWRRADHDLLIDRRGRPLARIGTATRTDLPVVAGAGAPSAAQRLVDLLARYPELTAQVLVSERVGERRWTLHLVDGRRIHLPEKDAASAIGLMMTGSRGARIFDIASEALDFRDPARVRVRRALRPGRRRPS